MSTIKSKKQQRKEAKIKWKGYISKKNNKKKKQTKVKYISPNSFEYEFNKRVGENSDYKSSNKKIRLTESQKKRRVYQKYLRSIEWKSFRERVLNLRGKKCQYCSDTENQIHINHIHYNNFTEERLEDVLVLCKDCHIRLHDEVKNPPYTLERLHHDIVKPAKSKY